MGTYKNERTLRTSLFLVLGMLVFGILWFCVDEKQAVVAAPIGFSRDSKMLATMNFSSGNVVGATPANVFAMTSADLKHQLPVSTTLDLITSGYITGTGYVLLAWENPVTSTNPFAVGWISHTIGTLPTTAYSIVAGDLNGDNWVDIVTGLDQGQGLVVWQNPGTGTPYTTWISNTIGTPADRVLGLAVGDLDNNGSLDIVTGTGREESPTGTDSNYKVTAWQNPGATAFSGSWTPTDVFAVGYSVHSIAIGDLDNDTWPDIVAGVNRANAITNSSCSPPPTPPTPECLALWVDHYEVQAYQNDSTPFVGGWTRNNVGRDPDTVSWQINYHGYWGATVYDVAIADLDADGYKDIVSVDSVEADYQAKVWKNDNTPFSGTWSATAVGIFAPWMDDAVFDVAVGDFGNGRMDIVTVSGVNGVKDGYEVNLWENTGRPFGSVITDTTWIRRQIGNTSNGALSVAVGDFDNDSDLDFATGSGNVWASSPGADRNVLIWQNQGFTADTPITGLSASNNGPTQLGNTTTFNSSVGGGTNVVYYWDFGDGYVDHQYSTHTYAATGVYTATVKAVNSSGFVTATTPVTITQANPTLATTPNPTSGAVGTTLNDSAVLSSGYTPTGTITFRLYAPSDATCSGTAAFTDTVTVNGNGAYTTTVGFVSNVVGTWHWTASYSGDSNNTSASSACSAEAVTIAQASPTLNTTPNPTSGAIGATLNDSAVLSSGYTPTGNIVFRLYAPSDATCSGTAAFTNTVSVSGNNTYNTSSGFVSNAAGTWHWTASYSGDSNNVSASSACSAEAVTIAQVSPTLSTTPNPTSGALGMTLNDSAVLSSGYTPTGTITFRLYAPSDASCSGTEVFSNTVTVTGNNTYTTTIGFVSNAAGTWHWRANYSGDSNNASASSACSAEAVTIAQASPTLNTTPNPTSGAIGATLNDSAVLSSGYTPTGTITFRLYTPSDVSCSGTAAFTNTVTVSGNGTYNSSSGFASNAAGTWHWRANYSGDSNNASASSACSAEAVTIAQASPTLDTTPNPASGAVGTTLNDSAVLSGGYTPTGNIVFRLYAPSDATCSGTAAFTNTVSVSGNNTYNTSSGFASNAAGTWHWRANYSGDSNNASASSACSAEAVTITNVPISGLTASNSSPTMLGGSTYFTATITGGTGVSYAWNFGDGQPLGSGQNANHTYSAIGSYTAIVTATNSVSSSSASTLVTITPPVPTITSLSPSSAIAGDPTFVLTVNGANFISGSIVRWNGSDRTTVFVNSTRLTATIPASDITTATTASITVFNPGGAGATSNARLFTISYFTFLPMISR